MSSEETKKRRRSLTLKSKSILKEKDRDRDSDRERGPERGSERGSERGERNLPGSSPKEKRKSIHLSSSSGATFSFSTLSRFFFLLGRREK